jgi:hypothetical protein
MRKETSKTRYGTQRPAKACESAGCNAAQTHPADASVAAKRRLLTLVALRLKKVACEHRCGRCTLHL